MARYVVPQSTHTAIHAIYALRVVRVRAEASAKARASAPGVTRTDYPTTSHALCGGQLSIRDAVAPVLLGLVEGRVRAADDGDRIGLGRHGFRDAEAGGDNDRVAVPVDGVLLQVVAQHLGHAPRARQRRLGQQDEELLAAPAALDVAAAQDRF